MPVSGFSAVPMWLFFLQTAVEAAAVVLFILNRRRFREFFKPAIAIAAIGFVLNAPFQVLAVYQMDMKKVFEGFSLPLTAEDLSLLRNIVAAATVAQTAVYFGLVMLAFVAAAGEWDRLRPRPFPLLMRTGEKVWPKNLAAAGLGVAGAAVSLVFVHLLHVGASDFMKELFPESAPALVPPGVEIVLELAFVVSAAAAEEILFRGAILGFLLRASRSNTAALLASIFSVSLLWALLHYPNTDSPTFKIAQVFVLGVILAEVTRRWSLESSVVLHVSFNVASLAIAYLPIG
jgi:membrane protease YdiL (CAAX protease family)